MGSHGKAWSGVARTPTSRSKPQLATTRCKTTQPHNHTTIHNPRALSQGPSTGSHGTLTCGCNLQRRNGCRQSWPRWILGSLAIGRPGSRDLSGSWEGCLASNICLAVATVPTPVVEHSMELIPRGVLAVARDAPCRHRRNTTAPRAADSTNCCLAAACFALLPSRGAVSHRSPTARQRRADRAICFCFGPRTRSSDDLPCREGVCSDSRAGRTRTRCAPQE